MVDRAAACGLVAEVSWELELIVLDQSGAEVGDPTRSPPVLKPAMFDNRCWSALTPAVEAEAIAGLVAALAAGDVPVDHVCAELGPGCLELAIEHGPAVRAADDATLAKLFTKAYYAGGDRRPRSWPSWARASPAWAATRACRFRRPPTGGRWS